MRNEKPLNITHKNIINKIGDSLIAARRAIIKDNSELHLSVKQQLRLVLLACLYLEKLQSEEQGISKNIETTVSISHIISFFENITYGDQNWIQDYLCLLDSDMQKIKLKKALKNIAEHVTNPLFGSLLPYAIELLEYSDQELSTASRDRRDGIITRKKKNSGIYYTPLDVASYMVERCLNKLCKNSEDGKKLLNYRYADFSCGSGIFLLQILRSIVSKTGISSVNEYLSFVSTSLFGVDISNQAIDCAHYTLLSYIMKNAHNERVNIASILQVLSKNIVCADATKLASYISAHPDFPQRFDCIIGNPPYVGTSETNMPKTTETGRSNLFIPFVINLIDYSGENAISSLVLPLSFSYNKQSGYINMRNRIQGDKAIWYIENYDRSPDSLFGDDVKSRNCIIFREASNEYRLYTTGLLRWTSVDRSRFLLSEKQIADMTSYSISEYIPKLGTDIEKLAFSRIVSQPTSLMNILSPVSSAKDGHVFLKGTAYNWICSYDHIPPGKDKNGVKYISKDLKCFSTKTLNELYFVLAVLNSTIAFWLWTVIGDGFHVTDKLLLSFGISNENISQKQYSSLVSLGREFSGKIVHYPTQSVNSGKIVTSYNHLPLMDVIFKIDEQITNSLKLPKTLPDYLLDWYSNIVTCGRPQRSKKIYNPDGGKKQCLG
ncbi:MAG: N5-glutamine S-adenosyl-L-methionine-dependent methyltransferase [Pelotomaculum sp. PtaB.Bin013]|nr:MAG: N5-glutamine S-adenosyl-L-methionine-dependent methyltransferase [Pelotomaculum sp. PtaB.Bin013]